MKHEVLKQILSLPLWNNERKEDRKKQPEQYRLPIFLDVALSLEFTPWRK